MTAVFLDEDDVATYTVKTIDDPRTLNKTIYLRPPENILSQIELVQMWEKLSGKELSKDTISDQDFLALMKGMYNLDKIYDLYPNFLQSFNLHHDFSS